MADRVERVSEETGVVGDRVVTERAVTTESRDASVAKTEQIVWFIVGVLVFLLILRMILALLGANPENAFADLIYTISNLFVAPFRGLLQVGTLQLGVSRFETETLIAVIVYTLIGWGVVKLINLGRKDTVV